MVVFSLKILSSSWMEALVLSELGDMCHIVMHLPEEDHCSVLSFCCSLTSLVSN